MIAAKKTAMQATRTPFQRQPSTNAGHSESEYMPVNETPATLKKNKIYGGSYEHWHLPSIYDRHAAVVYI